MRKGTDGGKQNMESHEVKVGKKTNLGPKKDWTQDQSKLKSSSTPGSFHHKQ
jgi:hypothetical protein